MSALEARSKALGEAGDDPLIALQWHDENNLSDVWSEHPEPLIGQTPNTHLFPQPDTTPKINSAPSATPAAKPETTKQTSAPKPRQDDSTNLYKGPEVTNPELKELYEEICTFQGCDLKDTAISTVIADGNPNAKIMLIGEAPGADEDRTGRPFVGVSGQLLDKMMAAIGIDRQHVLVSNMVFWRPPGNRKPTLSESEICLQFTKRHIELVQPQVILLVGALAAQKILGTNDSITRLRGKWASYQLANGETVESMPLLHPAYLLRQPRYKRESWIDFLKVKEKLLELDLLPNKMA